MTTDRTVEDLMKGLARRRNCQRCGDLEARSVPLSEKIVWLCYKCYPLMPYRKVKVDAGVFRGIPLEEKLVEGFKILGGEDGTEKGS